MKTRTTKIKTFSKYKIFIKRLFLYSLFGIIFLSKTTYSSENITQKNDINSLISCNISNQKEVKIEKQINNISSSNEENKKPRQNTILSETLENHLNEILEKIKQNTQKKEPEQSIINSSLKILGILTLTLITILVLKLIWEEFIPPQQTENKLQFIREEITTNLQKLTDLHVKFQTLEAESKQIKEKQNELFFSFDNQFKEDQKLFNLNFSALTKKLEDCITATNKIIAYFNRMQNMQIPTISPINPHSIISPIS